MKKKVPYFSKQFCQDIKEKAKLECFNYIASFVIDLKQYDDAGQLEFIESKQNQTSQDLKESDYHIWFPLQDIETNMDQNLEAYFRGNLISQAIDVKFNASMAIGNYKYNSDTRKITVKPLPRIPLSETSFNFGLLNDFKPLILHLNRCMFLLELDRMGTEIQKNNPPSGKKKVPPTLHLLKRLGEEPKIMPIDPSTPSKKFLQFFKNEGYDLFCYLDAEYTIDEHTPKTKYSNIYQFLKYHQIIICSQRAYIDFIEKQMGVRLSKIFPANYKYDVTILPLLSQLKSNFEKRN